MPDRANVVAVIDDDAVTREGLKLMLATLGSAAELYDSAETFLADSAETFLARVGESAAACLVVDIQLDAVSGIELGRGLAAAGLKLPVIYMTASPDQALRQRAVDAGCVAFLRKPVARQERAEALAAARRCPGRRRGHAAGVLPTRAPARDRRAPRAASCRSIA